MNPIALLIAGLALVGGLFVWWFLGKLEQPIEKTQRVVQIQIVRPPENLPPPPPPPPPPPEEEVDIPEPEVMPDIAEPNLEPNTDSGIDGPPGEDAFGQQRGNGGDNDKPAGPYSLEAHKRWVAQLAKDRIRTLLSQQNGIKRGQYTIPIRLWLDNQGGLADYELLRSTGDPSVDRAIEAALAGFGRISQAPPPNMPPFRVRVEYRT